eukprot:3940339-Rhodomonas_salina.7
MSVPHVSERASCSAMRVPRTAPRKYYSSIAHVAAKVHELSSRSDTQGKTRLLSSITWYQRTPMSLPARSKDSIHLHELAWRRRHRCEACTHDTKHEIPHSWYKNWTGLWLLSFAFWGAVDSPLPAHLLRRPPSECTSLVGA